MSKLPLTQETPRAIISATNPIAAKPTLPFVQELVAKHGNDILGTARWHAPCGEDGVVQLLSLEVHTDHQRKHHGSALLREVYSQAGALFKRLNIKPRRLWTTVEQKSQVNARAFFSRHGFHHVATIKNIHKRQDLLIYSRSFD